MSNLSKNENRLIREFLEDYREMLHKEGVPFNPRNLTIISQRQMDNEKLFDFISYNKWFDEMDVDTQIGCSSNILHAFLEIPTQILISAEKINKSLLCKKDQKKVIKALKLLSEVTVERQK